MKQIKFVSIIFCLFFVISSLNASDAKWIYYPGDFEIYLHKRLMLQRTERNQPYVPMWRVDSPYGTVVFSKMVDLKKNEQASIKVDGTYFIRFSLDNKILYNYNPDSFTLPAGKYTINVFVKNYETVPAIWFKSQSVNSDNSWTVSAFNGDNLFAETYSSDNLFSPPSKFRLQTELIKGEIIEKNNQYSIYDFGKNTFAFPVIMGLKGEGNIYLYYGESLEEARSQDLAETWDVVNVNHSKAHNDTLPTKAFRYVMVKQEGNVSFRDFTALYEYLPVTQRGRFECSDELINNIYETSLYTFHLTMREVHLDGIKRDRWAWSGDALQSYLMNMYSFFDEDVNKRTIWGLRGHSPVSRHINTILDYSFYWLIGIELHYNYTGDMRFVKQIYPLMKETMNFCICRLNKNRIAEGKNDDWVFVDWANMSKKGELSFEQLLFIRSLKSMAFCASLAGDDDMHKKMISLYGELLNEFDEIFWSADKGAYIHNRVNGKISTVITRYTNMFAILFDMIDNNRKEEIKKNVLLNDSILKITTPYMKFYELAALCEANEHEKVLEYMKLYWGGMLNWGATTFWEMYDPEQPKEKQYEMYDRPFGKSLCHAWGANPIYIMGRYFLGIYPTEAGYKSYIVRPNLGGLKWMKGVVPTNIGDISLNMTKKRIVIKTNASTGGVLEFESKVRPQCNKGKIERIGVNKYQLEMSIPNFEYSIRIKQ